MCIRHDLQYLQFLQWIQQILSVCNGSVLVCGFTVGAQENWLITQHISRMVPGGQRLSKVTAQFEVTLNGCDTIVDSVDKVMICIHMADFYYQQNCCQKH